MMYTEQEMIEIASQYAKRVCEKAYEQYDEEIARLKLENRRLRAQVTKLKEKLEEVHNMPTETQNENYRHMALKFKEERDCYREKYLNTLRR